MHNEELAEVIPLDSQDLGNTALLQESGTSQRQPRLPQGAVGYPDWHLHPKTQAAPNLLPKHRLQSTGDVVILVTHRFLPYGNLDVRITLKEETERF